VDPWRIDAELKGVIAMRDRWDEVLGKVALELKRTRAFEVLRFANFGQYCEERLGMAKRTVAQRIALERSLRRFPLLRQALREKGITYEKARVIAQHIWTFRRSVEGARQADADDAATEDPRPRPAPLSGPRLQPPRGALPSHRVPVSGGQRR
jgi:hypothetical protein